ncbi:MAG: CDC27 family protein [Bacteroidales bacterium]
MKRIIIFFIGLSVFLNYSCSNKKLHNTDNVTYNEGRELEYYYAFTEATKLSLFGRYKDALSLYNQCLRVKPQSSAVYYQISGILLRTGQLDLAKKFALDAYRHDNQNYWYLMHLASIYKMQMNLDSAIIMYEKILKIKSPDLTNTMNLALLLKANSKYKKALNIVTKVEKEYVINESVIMIKHDLLKNLNKANKAADVLIDGIEKYPDNINLYGLLAEHFYDENKLEDAEKYYKIVYNKDSANEKVILSYADFLLNNDRGDEAFLLYNKIIYDEDAELEDKILLMANFIKNYDYIKDYNENIFDLIDYLLNIYSDKRVIALAIDLNIKAKDFEKAALYSKDMIRNYVYDEYEFQRLLHIENYLNNYDTVIYYADKAISLYNNKAPFYLVKGVAYLGKDDFSNAIVSLRTGLERNTEKNDEINFYNYLAESYFRAGNNDSSDYFFEKSLSINNDNLLIRNNYSYYLALRNENLERAKELSYLTIKREPENATYLDTYAWILYKLKKYKTALNYIEKAVSINNENIEILEHYGDILYVNNKKKKALEIWLNAYKLNRNEVLEEKIKNLKNELITH